MKWCVYYLDIVCNLRNYVAVDGLLYERLIIVLINTCRNHTEQTVCNRLVLVHGLDILVSLYIRHMLQDILILRGYDLAAVLPVHLIAVVLRWIVACCYHDSGYTSKLSHCK